MPSIVFRLTLSILAAFPAEITPSRTASMAVASSTARERSGCLSAKGFQVFERVVEIDFGSLEDAVHRIPADAQHFSRLSRRDHTVTHGFDGGCFEHGARKVWLPLGQRAGDFVRKFHGDLHRATSVRLA